MNTDPVIRYAEIKDTIAKLNNELEFLAPVVLEKIKALAGDELNPVDTPLGTYIIAKAKTWEYSQNYQDHVKLLDELKKSEQATGVATFVEKEQLRFNIKK